MAASAADFTGAAVCGECHPKQFKTQTGTHHARALRPINDTELPELLRPLQERGGASFAYRKTSEGVEVSVTRDSDTTRAVLEWCFGAGAKGYTPVGRTDNGEFFEHRVSWYVEAGRLSLTTGHPPETPPDLQSALGVAQSPAAMARCFGCHRTGTEPGVRCERCHGPGGDHVAVARAGKPLAKSIFNPATLPARARVQVCAECHRSPDVEFRSTMPELDDPISVRFAPVGFQASACFLKSKTFSCVTCHDPHADLLPRADSFYTSACLGCHKDAPSRPSACKRALKTNCVGCHMKTATPLPHLTFSDHRIRVYLD